MDISIYLTAMDLNHPPTAVGGIFTRSERILIRKILNIPPTAVGGISEFGQRYAEDGCLINHLERFYDPGLVWPLEIQKQTIGVDDPR